MLRRKKLRRTVGGILIVLGGLLMWLAPGPTFGSQSAAGLTLLVAGIVLEVVGLALEHKAGDRR
jgi:drug/metabolite transporter (DMT)-like permease